MTPSFPGAPLPDEPVDGYVADGHRLVGRVASGVLRVEIECPGPEKCKGGRDDRARGDEWQCNLQLLSEAGGLWFTEWQLAPFRKAELPCEIEWLLQGWADGCDLWWRPVEAEGG